MAIRKRSKHRNHYPFAVLFVNSTTGQRGRRGFDKRKDAAAFEADCKAQGWHVLVLAKAQPRRRRITVISGGLPTLGRHR